MHIGLDLDNTLICYDSVFHEAASTHGLIEAATPKNKNAVKAVVILRHGNDAWTQLQGEVYGSLIFQATAYQGTGEFLRRCRAAGHTLCILSHKSQFSAIDPSIDLRQAALRWLDNQGWLDFTKTGLSREQVEFHDTRQLKVAAIARHHCDLFIDDLPEVLAATEFPAHTAAILFDPKDAHEYVTTASRYSHWDEITEAVLTGVTT